MKKILPLFLALASLGLMADPRTINIADYNDGILNIQNDSEVVLVGEANLWELTIETDCTVHLNGCIIKDEDGYGQTIQIYANKTVNFVVDADSVLKSETQLASGATLNISGSAKLKICGGGLAFKINGGIYGGATLNFNGCNIDALGWNGDDEMSYFCRFDDSTTPCKCTITDSTIGWRNGWDEYPAFDYSNDGTSIVIDGGSFCIEKETSPICPAGKTPVTTGASPAAEYCATLPNACPSAGTYSYTVKKGTATAMTYSGPGHDSMSEDLYFYLPNGDYTVDMGGQKMGCTIENEAAEFEAVPEPCFGLLALLGLCFLRRK